METTAARYRITHRTEYKYSEPVAVCQNQLRLTPRSMTRYDRRVKCHHSELKIHPQPDSLEQHEDYFGNHVHSFSIESSHRRLTVEASSDVSIQQTSRDLRRETAWEDVLALLQSRRDPGWLEVMEYCFDSPRISSGDSFAQYARASFTPGRDLLTAGLDLTRRIHADFRYDAKATDVSTPTTKAFSMRAGVCQDFAHVQIACLRSLGLPARYVSGYLRTNPPPGQPRLVGADESHAWVSLYGGELVGWIDLDPTNACLADTNHIPLSVGRDYSDVTPMRGVVTGGGVAALRVSVHVEPIEEV